MIKGIDINQRINFSFKNDQSEPKTVFVLRPLSPTEFSEFSKFDPETKTAIVSKDSIISVLCNAVDEIRNYQIGEKTIDSAKDKETKREVFMSLPMAELNEVFSEIIAMNKLGDIEAKNL